MPKSIIDIKIDKVIQIFLGKIQLNIPRRMILENLTKPIKLKNTSEFCTSHIT